MATPTTEILALRDKDTKHFDTDSPGERVAIVGQNLHYQKPDDSWDDYANLVQPVTGGWQAQTKDVTFGVLNGNLAITYKGQSLTMRPTMVGLVDATAPATRYRKLADASYANVTRNGPVITVHDIFPGTDLTVSIRHDQMSKAFTVRSRPTLPDPSSLGWNAATTYLVFGWDVNVPAGATVRDTVTHAVVGYGYASHNDLVVEDNLGNPVVYFKAGTATSAG